MIIFQEERHIKNVRQQWIEWIDDEDGGYPTHQDKTEAVTLSGTGEYNPNEPFEGLVYVPGSGLVKGAFNCTLLIRNFIGDFHWGGRTGFNVSSEDEARRLCEEAFEKEVHDFSNLQSLQDDNRSKEQVWANYHEEIDSEHIFGAEL